MRAVRPVVLVAVVLTATAPLHAGAVDALLLSGVSAYRAGAPLHALAYFAGAARRDPRSAIAALWAGVAAVAAGRMGASGGSLCSPASPLR